MGLIALQLTHTGNKTDMPGLYLILGNSYLIYTVHINRSPPYFSATHTFAFCSLPTAQFSLSRFVLYNLAHLQVTCL